MQNDSKKKEKIAYASHTRLYVQLKQSNNGCDVPIVTRRNDIPCLAPSHIFLHVIHRISGRRVLSCVHLDRHRKIESLSRFLHLLSKTSTCVQNSTRNPRIICYCSEYLRNRDCYYNLY